jgi:hypothetical protein
VLAPDDASLAQADEAFVTQLGVEGVDLRRVDSFYAATRDGAAVEYAEALADYVRAVLVKDGDPHTGVSTRLHHYHEIQSRALNALQSFERPLAKLLSSLIRFALNDFSRWWEATGFPELDHAQSALGQLTQYSPAKPGGKIPMKGKMQAHLLVCPVDIGTDSVARLAKQAAALPRWGSAAEERFSGLADQASVDSFDRAKIRALWAATALRLGAVASAGRALRLLDGDPTFGDWASETLAKVEL